MKGLFSLTYVVLAVVLFAGCSEIRTTAPYSEGHLNREKAPNVSSDQTGAIPEPVRIAPSLPEPQPFLTEPTHTVVVHDVPVRELLFSLARDADLNLDIDANIGDVTVSINAIDQTLPAILERIANAAGLRYEKKNNVLSVRKDLPFLQSYRVDYLNMARSSRSNVTISTEISSTGQGADSEGGAGGGNNNSSTEVSNSAEHNFWASMLNNIAMILGSPMETEGSHPDILINRESGIVGVRATSRQHEEIEHFIFEVLSSTQRQVLIEATIAEVKLSDRYQAGIDWAMLNQNGGTGTDVLQTFNDINLFDRPNFAMTITDAQFGDNVLQATLRALETFGDVSIMSSPKVMALNNQTALLKVVDNLVYFTIEVDIERGEEDEPDIIVYETTVNTLPVGFVMSVTPYINEHDTVTLNVRPTISRVIDQARDPSPALAEANVVNDIPVVQVREVESVLKVQSNDIAVIGGLMQDVVNNSRQGVPLLSEIPFLGSLFRYQDDERIKTELVIFIKPKVINHASVNSELGHLRRYLPQEGSSPTPHSEHRRYFSQDNNSEQ